MNKSLNLILALTAAIASMGSIFFMSAIAVPSGSYNSTHFRFAKFIVNDDQQGVYCNSQRIRSFDHKPSHCIFDGTFIR
jgi:hypothetical protein